MEGLSRYTVSSRRAISPRFIVVMPRADQPELTFSRKGIEPE